MVWYNCPIFLILFYYLEQEAEVEEERLRKEREARDRQDAMTLGETREQIQLLNTKLEELKNEKQQLFLRLKKVLNEDENRKKQQQQKDTEIYAMQNMQQGPHQIFLPPRAPNQQTNQKVRSCSFYLFRHIVSNSICRVDHLRRIRQLNVIAALRHKVKATGREPQVISLESSQGKHFIFNLIPEHEDGKSRGNEGGRAVLWNSKREFYNIFEPKRNVIFIP